MKNKFLLAFLALSIGAHAQIYTGKSYEVSFFSDGPIEDITATCKSAQVMLNAGRNDIAIKVTIKGFRFEKQLMEEHFNEKYMESDKYPYAEFSGKIKDSIDYKKDGIYKVTVAGKLKIHGVEKDRIITGTVMVKNGEVTVETKFNVALKDHNIEIPSVLVKNIAEIVEVNFTSTLVPFKQK
jgi:polyisoprenoid-binding protein YceI